MWTTEIEDDGKTVTIPPEVLEITGWSEGTVLMWDVYGAVVTAVAQTNPETNIEVRLP